MSCNAPEFSWVCKMAPGCESYSRNMIHHLERRGWAGQWMKAKFITETLMTSGHQIIFMIWYWTYMEKKSLTLLLFIRFFRLFILLFQFYCCRWNCFSTVTLHMRSLPPFLFHLLPPRRSRSEHLLTPDIFPSTNPFYLIRSYFSFSSDTFLVPSVPSTHNQHSSWCAPYC